MSSPSYVTTVIYKHSISGIALTSQYNLKIIRLYKKITIQQR